MERVEGIIAIATPVGRGGIGVIRVSGSRELVLGLMKDMTRVSKPLPRYAHYTEFLATDGDVIDKGVAIWYASPHSYTGEDVLEFQAHGNPVILNWLVKTALEVGNEAGLRLAEPGEFTRRAFLNAKIDLAQAESVMDIVNASSEEAVRAAQRSLAGDFSEKCKVLEEQLVALRTQVEAILDFPEEEIDFMQESLIRERVEKLELDLKKLQVSANQGSLLREGAVVALVGSPNVGKSSLLNRLSEREVSIVTDIPGTTRDAIENSVLFNGVLVRLVDTAGLHETNDLVESVGIQRALKLLEEADMVLHITSCEKAEEEDEALEDIKQHVPTGIPVITVFNKMDLLSEEKQACLENEDDRIFLSAKTGDGLDALKSAVLDHIGYNRSVQSVYFARRRHVEALNEAHQHILRAENILNSSNLQLDIVAEELRMGGRSLGDIVGEFSSDDLLGRIFSSFCIGK